MSHIKFRVTDTERDKARLNRALALVDEMENKVHRLEDEIGRLNRQQKILEERWTVAGSNNLQFDWTDATATISWNAGFIRDHDGVRIHHVPAGSRALTANTEYWAGWNPVHQTMSFEANLDTIQLIPNITVICRIQTGNGLDGVAGGGGTETSSVGILNKEYTFV